MKSSHGAANHVEYQQFCKEAATTFSLLMCNADLYLSQATKDLKAALIDKGVDIHFSSCKRQINRALGNNCIGISPQKPGGAYICSNIEKEVARYVESLKARNFLVFPGDVI